MEVISFVHIYPEIVLALCSVGVGLSRIIIHRVCKTFNTAMQRLPPVFMLVATS